MSDLESDLEFDGPSSDSSEEELEPFFRRQKNENFLDIVVPQYDDHVFMEHFRVSRRVVETLSERFEASEMYNRHYGQFGKISSAHQILIYLWFVGHQTASFRDVADRFNITISSLHRIINRITIFLSNMSPEIIVWTTDAEKREIEEQFREHGIPNVIGAIDGSHIKIDKPQIDSDSYINRKGYYSIQLQAVCDHTPKIRDIFVGYPGSVHDSRVFRNSPLGRQLEAKCGHYYLLGDSGYPLKNNLLTPFKDRGQLTRRQINYNIRLSQARVRIEHCFGLMKQKFRQLYHLKLRNIMLIVHCIRAACVLHNIALDDNIVLEELIEPILDVPFLPDDDFDDNEEDDDRDARRVRNEIVNLLH